MIPRYTRPEMGQLWAPETKFNLWLKVELAVLEAQEELGIAPKGVTNLVREKACFNIPRIDEIELTVKHDVIAFLTCVNEYVGENGRYLHYGMTSSDLIDTTLALQISHAGLLLLNGVDTLITAVYELAKTHKNTPMIGRSHGIHAEPITFGLKCLVWVDELKRHKIRLTGSVENLKLGQISGPVGTYSGSGISPELETMVCQKLGLKPAPISTQVLSRDTHAAFLSDLALLASSLEKIAVEIRHLQRTEVLEAEEPFTKGQKGSSAMPHKRNPVGSENITGLARLMRGYALPMIENVALWHERDISHSSVERIVLPDATIIMDYMLNRLSNIIEGLVVYPHNMEKNLFFKGGLAFSQHVLLALVAKGISREEAYALVQQNAMAAWEALDGNFQENLKADKNVLNLLTDDEIVACFDLKTALRHVDSIFARFL